MTGAPNSVRIVLPFSRLPTRTTLSLRAFARHGVPGAILVDGWGVALYDRADVRLFKEPEPAGGSARLKFGEGRRIASRRVRSPIRHAITGDISFVNTQPFTREPGGRRHANASSPRGVGRVGLASPVGHERRIGHARPLSGYPPADRSQLIFAWTFE